MHRKLFQKAGIVKNIILDLSGNIALIGISQFLIYPLLSQNLSSEKFGSLLTLVAISNLVGNVFGGTINNIRLIRNQEYKKNGFDGDFRIIVEYGAILTALGMLIGLSIFQSQVELNQWILLPLLSVFSMLRAYMGTEYRINLQYHKVMLHAVSTCIGYLIGIPIFYLTQDWTIIFLTGEILAFLFASFTTRFFFEPRTKTILFNKTVKETNHLLISNFMANILTYLDRLLINPVMGPENVSIYFIASMIGKSIGIVLQPVAGVTLSYISSATKSHASLLYIMTNAGAIIAGLLAFFISIPLSPIAIGILYPNLLNEVSSYFILANTSAILATVASLFQPVILRFCPLQWQVIIQLVYCFTYIILGYILMVVYQLYGFCVGSIIAQVIRIVLLSSVGYYYIIFKKTESSSR